MPENSDIKAFEKSWRDHDDLTFWPWACIRAGEEYLEASRNSRHYPAETSKRHQDYVEWSKKRLLLMYIVRLKEYQFLTTVGSLVYNFNRLVPLFPETQPVYDAAAHTTKEARSLRNMVEHEKDRQKTKNFVREVDEATAQTNLPGDQSGTVAASGTLVTDTGHWLGGRLNVEQVLKEVQAIFEVAKKIPPPADPRHGPPPPGYSKF